MENNKKKTEAQQTAPQVKKPKKKNKALRDFKKSIPFLFLASGGFITLIIFRLVPLFGLVLPFKEFRVADGILGSKWVGLDNFKYLFATEGAWIATRNTIFYNFVGIITGIIIGVTVALLLYELSNKFVKIYQTILYLPHFVSYVVVAFMMKGLLDLEYGIFNISKQYL